MTPPGQRRPQGTGSFFQRSSDGLWVGRIEAGFDAKGNRRRLQTTAKTKPEAARKLRELQRRASDERKAIADGASLRTTVKAWADVWLPIHEEAVRPNVYVTDRGAVRKWIVPTLGPRRLVDVAPSDLRRLTKAITDAGRSTTTARNVHAVLRKMLRDARLEGHEVQERVFDWELPAPAASDRDSIPQDQFARLLVAIGRRPDASRWLFAMLYGTRQGETLGLLWDAVDLLGEAVKIEWQLREYARTAKVPTRLRTRHLTGTAWLVEPKTKRGNRSWLPLVPPVTPSLAAWQAVAPPNEFGLVWADEHGKPIRPHRDRAEWYAIQAEARTAHPSGRPWYLHETRHTLVSWLLAEGVERSVIAAIVGQSALVEAYVHVDRAAIRAALGQAGARFELGG